MVNTFVSEGELPRLLSLETRGLRDPSDGVGELLPPLPAALVVPDEKRPRGARAGSGALTELLLLLLDRESASDEKSEARSSSSCSSAESFVLLLTLLALVPVSAAADEPFDTLGPLFEESTEEAGLLFPDEKRPVAREASARFSTGLAELRSASPGSRLGGVL